MNKICEMCKHSSYNNGTNKLCEKDCEQGSTLFEPKEDKKYITKKPALGMKCNIYKSYKVQMLAEKQRLAEEQLSKKG